MWKLKKPRKMNQTCHRLLLRTKGTFVDRVVDTWLTLAILCSWTVIAVTKVKRPKIIPTTSECAMLLRAELSASRRLGLRKFVCAWVSHLGAREFICTTQARKTNCCVGGAGITPTASDSCSRCSFLCSEGDPSLYEDHYVSLKHFVERSLDIHKVTRLFSVVLCSKLALDDNTMLVIRPL